MIEYKFYKNEIGTPQFSIGGNLEVLSELGSCNLDYLNEIISSLEDVLSGKLEQYDFGYEILSIESRQENSNIVDTYNDWKTIAEVPTSEIYNLMKDWRSYLEKHSTT